MNEFRDDSVDPSVEFDDAEESGAPPSNGVVEEYARIVKATLTFGDRLDREDFFRHLGLFEFPAAGPEDPRGMAMEAFRLLRMRHLAALKNHLRDTHHLVVTRDTRDLILQPTEVRAYADTRYRNKARRIEIEREAMHEVADRYEAEGMIHDRIRARDAMRGQARPLET